MLTETTVRVGLSDMHWQEHQFDGNYKGNPGDYRQIRL